MNFEELLTMIKRKPIPFVIGAVLIIGLFGTLAVGCLGGGNYSTYRQEATGKKYRYISLGEVSYYGPGFHGKTTASGEIFNKNALTAAHANLPFGTRLRITNVDEGTQVVVRVNDRFPGTKGRALDLSEGAFKQLAPLARGIITAQVEVVE